MESKHPKSNTFGILFMILLLGIAFFNFFHKDVVFSKEENRNLTLKPVMNQSDLLSGDYQKKYENNRNDQFIGRAKGVSIKNRLEHKLGNNKIDDVYIANNNLLMQSFTTPSSAFIKEKADALLTFKQKYPTIPFSMILSPNKISIYEDQLPSNAPKSNQPKIMEEFQNQIKDSVSCLDVYATLNPHKKETIFYKGDHHLTTLGAKYVFEDYMAMKQIPLKDITYEKHISNADFVGSLSNKIGFHQIKDQVELYLPVNDPTQVVVNYVGEQSKKPTFYDASKQFSSSAYDVFLSGNHPYIKIATTSLENRRLLILKDSFANCMIPFLAPYYNEINVIDPRYYYGDLDALMVDEAINEVLIIGNANTFFADSSLQELLMGE
ncbi:MAG: DHHW family protein [Erysipelotrichaceae bacterium]